MSNNQKLIYDIHNIVNESQSNIDNTIIFEELSISLNEGFSSTFSAFALAGALLLGGWIGYQNITLVSEWNETYHKLEQQEPDKAKRLKKLINIYKFTDWKKVGLRHVTKNKIEKIIDDFEKQELKKSTSKEVSGKN